MLIVDADDRWQADILEEHLEDLVSLVGARAAATRDPDLIDRAWRRFDRRIAAHADALILAGAAARRGLIAALEDPDRAQATAVAMVAAATRDRLLWQATLTAFTGGSADCCEGIVFGVALTNSVEAMHELAAISPATPAAEAAGTWLRARLGQVIPATTDIGAWLQAGQAGLSRLGWKVLAEAADQPEVGSAFGRLDPAIHADALASDDEDGHCAWLQAACRVRWPNLCDLARRQLADATNPGRAAGVLARLGSDADIELIHAHRERLSAESYCDALERSGRPMSLPWLIEAMAGEDAARAALAALAFERLTGATATTGERVMLPPPPGLDPDFADELPQADPAQAAQVLAQGRATWGGMSRLRHGRALPALRMDDPQDWPEWLDRAATHDAYLRTAIEAGPCGQPFELERLALPILPPD